MELKDIIHQQQKYEKSNEYKTQYELYLKRAYSESKKHGFYVASALGNDKMMYPFSLSLHPYSSNKSPIPHRHDFFELVYVINGSAHNKMNDFEIVLQKGDLLLMNPQAIHSLYVTSPNDIVFNFLIPEETFHHSFFTMMSDNVISNFIFDYMYQLHKTSNYLILNSVESPALYEVLNRLIIEYYEKLPGYQTILELGLAQALSYMSRICAQQFSGSDLLPYSSKLGSIMLYILKNYTTVTLKEVAYMFNYSEKYISRLIKKELQISFSELIKNVKLQHAASLLKNTTQSIETIIFSVGYQNKSYFYTIFAEKYNMTPLEYRQQNLTL